MHSTQLSAGVPPRALELAIADLGFAQGENLAEVYRQRDPKSAGTWSTRYDVLCGDEECVSELLERELFHRAQLMRGGPGQSQQLMPPLREGVARIVKEALDADVKVGVCGAFDIEDVSALLQRHFAPQEADNISIFALHENDLPPPHPAAYLQVAQAFDVDPGRCVVLEHCKAGVIASRAAGMRVVGVPSKYTNMTDLELADAVFETIGDEGYEQFFIDDLTTPGSFWINPPLPRDEHGNKYEEDVGNGEEVEVSMVGEEAEVSMIAPQNSLAEKSLAEDNGELTADELAILADLD
ncbi:hypothetical protein CYMTET_40888 [Cymbomonas tetramitiformis]|uniref:Uncharacterized protein n=1 Tax=Cymbomonas tetramitiformis TaxID=36881 RepID=A0AAE0F2H7_9CHLO|nr:hypothetical protein CYMTET_40888 [Cymbomonas tetramitiformis]